MNVDVGAALGTWVREAIDHHAPDRKIWWWAHEGSRFHNRGNPEVLVTMWIFNEEDGSNVNTTVPVPIGPKLTRGMFDGLMKESLSQLAHRADELVLQGSQE